MQKIIVTGGTGYIGAHTAVCLIERGYEVVIIDNLVNSDQQTIQRIAAVTGVRPGFEQVDMRQAQALDDFIARHKDAVGIIHFAALKAVKESVELPLEYYQNNLLSLINLLVAMRKHGLNNLVFSSSATVYGEPETLPLTEESPTKPAINPYGNTKKVGEEIIRDLAKADTAFQAVSLRYFNPIGAHPSGLLGELPNGIPNNLLPFITQTAVGIREELLVFGDDYPTVDGTAVRDYVHVVDLAAAHVQTIERLLNQKQEVNYEVFNLGTGKGSSVLEVIRSFEKASGQKLSYRIVERRAGDVAEMYASTDLANQSLGWAAKLDLDDMTASAWIWECKLRAQNI